MDRYGHQASVVPRLLCVFSHGISIDIDCLGHFICGRYVDEHHFAEEAEQMHIKESCFEKHKLSNHHREGVCLYFLVEVLTGT